MGMVSQIRFVVNKALSGHFAKEREDNSAKVLNES